MIAVLIPTLNESEAIEEVITSFPESYRGEKLKVYVIDGGSTDGTVEIARATGATIIKQRLGGGKGNGIKQALREIEADKYLMIDGDGTYDPREFKKVLKPISDGEAEHVIGWRKNREKGSIPLLNRFGNNLFNIITSIWTGKSVHDMLSGYRAFTRYSLDYTDITRPGFGVETEMTFTALENEVPLEEVPISYSARKGESKLNPVKDGWRIINTLIWTIRDTNPLPFFFLISGVFLLLTLYPSSLVISEYLEKGMVTKTFPALITGILIVLAVQFAIFGLLADQINNLERRLKNRRG